MARMLVGTLEGLFSISSEDPLSPLTPILLAQECDYGEIRCPVLRDRDDPTLLYLATTRRGVMRSEDNGRSWQESNEGLIYKEVWWISQQPFTGYLFAGTGPVSLYRSVDKGIHWDELKNIKMAEGRADWFLHLPPYFPRMRDISFGARDQLTFACAIEEGWITKSIDGGENWIACREGLNPDVHALTFVPEDPQILIAATGDGLYRSCDAGATFTRCYEVDKPYVTHVLSDSRLPSTIFVVASNNLPRHWRTSVGAGTGFFVSRDKGRSWSQIIVGAPEYISSGAHGVLWDPFDSNVVHIGLSDGSIWRANLDGKVQLVRSDLLSITSIAIA